MSGHPSIHDVPFERTVSLRDAYRVMERFLEAHVKRGEASAVSLLSYLGLLPDGTSGDPAALRDFLDAAEDVANAARQPGQTSE